VENKSETTAEVRKGEKPVSRGFGQKSGSWALGENWMGKPGWGVLMKFVLQKREKSKTLQTSWNESARFLRPAEGGKKGETIPST